MTLFLFNEGFVSCSGHFLTRLRSQRVVTSGTVNLKPSPCLDYEWVRRLT